MKDFAVRKIVSLGHYFEKDTSLWSCREREILKQIDSKRNRLEKVVIMSTDDLKVEKAEKGGQDGISEPPVKELSESIPSHIMELLAKGEPKGLSTGEVRLLCSFRSSVFFLCFLHKTYSPFFSFFVSKQYEEALARYGYNEVKMDEQPWYLVLLSKYLGIVPLFIMITAALSAAIVSNCNNTEYVPRATQV